MIDKMENSITTTHKLDFLSADWPINDSIKLFKIGTCHGQWYCKDSMYVILSVMNDEQGNGHLEDVFQWFEFAAKRDKYKLMVQHIMNERFMKHLLTKRGFAIHEKDSAIKSFNN